jgi:hypothetical protein
MASPLHICCASDAKAGPKLVESAVAAKAMAEKSAALLVRRKFIDAFPKVAARCWPRFVRGRCTRLAMPHASSITRKSPGVVARILPMFESKVLRRPASKYAPMIRSCNGLLQHFFDCCVLATSIAANDPDLARPGCQARSGASPALQNSVEMRRFRVSRQPAVRENRFTIGSILLAPGP